MILGSNHYFRFHFPAAAGSPRSRRHHGEGSDADSFDDDDARHTWEEAHSEAVAALQEALGDRAAEVLLDPGVGSGVGNGSGSISPGSGDVVPAEELAIVQQRLQGYVPTINDCPH